MKKAVVVLLVTAFALSMLAFLAGCGGDASKDEAKNLMSSGDNYMSTVKLKTEELEALQTDLAATAMGGDMSVLSGEAGEVMQEQVAEILGAIETNLTAAKAEYEQILDLDGVQDYKDYASLMIEAVDAYMEQLGYTTTLVEKFTEALLAMAQGQDIDIITLMMESEELQKIEDLGKQGDDLVDEADQLKLEKKLEN
jgi:outer membrane lipopolysaccharide assembly protein LptE/RlpB